MKTYAKGKSVKIEQAWVVLYDCEWTAEIEKYDMKLVGSFSMPKWWKSIMTSINEQVRIECKDYLERNKLLVDLEEEQITVNYDQLHGAIMKMFTNAIDKVNEKWDYLFDIDINISKTKEKELINELNWIEKNIKELKYEIDAYKKIESKMREKVKRLWVDVDTTDTHNISTSSNSKQWDLGKPKKSPKNTPKWVVAKPKKSKPLKFWDFEFKS